MKTNSSFKSKIFNAKTYESTWLAEEEILNLKEAFDLFDKTGKGEIDSKGKIQRHTELKATLGELNFNPKDPINQLIVELDTGNSYNIDFEEFLQLIAGRVTDKDTRENIKKIFNLFDIEKKGLISKANLKRVAEQLNEPLEDSVIDEMISRADKNNDGLITEQEFYYIVSRKTFL